MQIGEIKLKIIKDSRDKDTLEARIETCEGKRGILGWASVPAGKSTGTHEAKALEPKKALKIFDGIKDKLISVNFRDQKEFDSLLLALDGTEDKSKLGGNLILSLSLAFARAFAKSQNIELYRYIKDLLAINYSSPIDNFPRPLFNVINGGAHVEIPSSWNKKFGVKSSLDFQEFQVIPTTNDFSVSLGVGREFYVKLGRELEKIYGKENIFLGDEAGYVCPFKTNEEALEILQELINRNLYPLKIGLDTAASQFHVNTNGNELGKRIATNGDADDLYAIEGEKITSGELAMLYYNLAHRYELISLEDPFNEESFDDFAIVQKELPNVKIITDDLTTTNSKRLIEAVGKKSAKAILIKPNQIGTLTETLEVVALAYHHKWQAVVSHRSGETLDDFIADLAVGIGAWGLKSGAPEKPERMVKYNRVLEIWGRSNDIK